MQVTVQLSPEGASELCGNSSKAGIASSIERILSETDTQLLPMHPSTNDPELATHFYAWVDDATSAQPLVNSLLRCPGVLAAYIKPADEAP